MCDAKDFAPELTASQVHQLADFQSVPQGSGWNLYFANQGSAPYGIYVYQKPNQQWTNGSVGAAWRVVNIAAKVQHYGPFPLPVGFSASMIDQNSVYNNPNTSQELINYSPLPAIPRSTPVNASQPLPMGTVVTYDQNFAQQVNGQYVPSFSITSNSGPAGVVEVVNQATYVPNNGSKNQRTVLQVEKNGLPLMQSEAVSMAGMPPNATYKGGLPPGFNGFLSVESKIYVGLSAGIFQQGQTYSYQQLSQNVVSYELPGDAPNNILVTLSDATPPQITFRQFTPTNALDAEFGAILASNLGARVGVDIITLATWAGGALLFSVVLHGSYTAISRGYRFQNLVLSVPALQSSVSTGDFDLPDDAREFKVQFDSPLIKATLLFSAPANNQLDEADAAARRCELEELLDQALDAKDFDTLGKLTAERKALDAVGDGSTPTAHGDVSISEKTGRESEKLPTEALAAPK